MNSTIDTSINNSTWTWDYFWTVWERCATHGNWEHHSFNDHLDRWIYGDDGVRYLN